MVKKKKYLLGIMSLVIFLAVGMSSIYLIAPHIIFSVITPDINLKDEKIGSINLNQNISEFNEGDVSKESNTLNTYYLSNGLRLITDKNGSIRIIAITHDTDKTIKTSRGITVGDSLENVKNNYGKDFYNRQEQGTEIIVYVDNNKFIEFWHWDNKVQEIRYGTKSNS